MVPPFLFYQSQAKHRMNATSTHNERADLLVTTEGALAAGTASLVVTETSQRVAEHAQAAYEALLPDRQRYRRARNYLFGDQWSDYMLDENGRTVREEDYIKQEGRIPWRLNHLRPIVRNLKGQLRLNQSDRAAYSINRSDADMGEMLTTALRQVRRINRAEALETDGFQAHLASGKVAFRCGFNYIPRLNRRDVVVQMVNPLRLFYNSDLTDRRLWDLRLIGQLHDLTVSDVVAAFAARDRAKARAIEEHYQYQRHQAYSAHHAVGFDLFDQDSFHQPTNPALCRVIEVWQKESRWVELLHDPLQGRVLPNCLSRAEIEHENEARRAQGLPELAVDERYEQVWYGYYLTPDGHVLWEGVSPFAHQEHPFILGFADFMDGQCAGIMDDLIDQQRLYNRMIQRMDEAIATSVHGTLMVPEEMVPEGMTNDEYAREITRVNGIVFYSLTDNDGLPLNVPAGVRPEMVHHQAIPSGAFQWLAQMKQDLETVSGVTGPVMGQTPTSGTSASLYHQQIVQGSTTNIDFFESYLETLAELDRKALSLILQFYDERRSLRTPDGRMVQFDPERAHELEYDVTIARVADTATYRQLFEADLQRFLNEKRLTFRQYLQASSHPRAEAILRLIDRTNALQTGNPQDLPRDVQHAIQEMGGAETLLSADPAVMKNALARAAEAGDADAAALLRQTQ